MFHTKFRVAASILLAISLITGLTSLAIAKPSETIPLQILAINDFHGALDQEYPGRSEYLSRS